MPPISALSKIKVNKSTLTGSVPSSFVLRASSTLPIRKLNNLSIEFPGSTRSVLLSDIKSLAAKHKIVI